MFSQCLTPTLISVGWVSHQLAFNVVQNRRMYDFFFVFCFMEIIRSQFLKMALSVGFHYRHTGSLTRLRSYSHQMGLMGNAQRSVCVVYSVIHKSAKALTISSSG